MQRIILHIDMNSYFASVEQQANPHLRGKPVGVCEHLGGIIIAPSVEAKRLGIKLGTPVWEARKIYPQIVLLPTDPDKYRHVSTGFMKILCDYSDEVEQYSIDEAFVDITKYCSGNFDGALFLGLEIKQRLAREVGEWVSSSIGVGSNKLVAKIAADLGEGDINRIFIVKPGETESLYDRLKLTDIPGIGIRLERALHKLQIFNLRELRDYPLGNLINQFGIWGQILHDLGNLRSTNGQIMVGAESAKSVGHAYTLPKATTDISEIQKLMYKLCEKVGRRLRKLGGRGSVIRYFHSDYRHGYSGFGKQKKIKDSINSGREIYSVARQIFLEGRGESAVSVKIMGVSISGLTFAAAPEFLFTQYQKPQWLAVALDKINEKYGDYAIRPGSLVDAPEAWAKDTVGFGRTKEG